MFQIGAGLLKISMGPKVNACSSRRGAPAVFKSVLHVLDATLDKPGHSSDVGKSSRPGRTALGGVTSLSRKCSSLQQEVRDFSSFALFVDWTGGFDQVMSALSGDVHCF